MNESLRRMLEVLQNQSYFLIFLDQSYYVKGLVFWIIAKKRLNNQHQPSKIYQQANNLHGEILLFIQNEK